MYLKENIDIVDFLNTAQKCIGETFFKTAEGDILNIKSQLSRYLFLAASKDARMILDGQVVCSLAADEALLKPFCK